jgi:hypothetical protein
MTGGGFGIDKAGQRRAVRLLTFPFNRDKRNPGARNDVDTFCMNIQ